MDPLTPLETLCRIIFRAREYEAQTASDYDRDEAWRNMWRGLWTLLLRLKRLAL